MAKKARAEDSFPMKTLLFDIVTNTSAYRYPNIPSTWQFTDKINFSSKIALYSYQEIALECVASALYLYYGSEENGSSDGYEMRRLYCEKLGYYEHRGKIDPIDLEHVNRACFWMATGSGKSLVLVKTIEHIDYLMAQGLIPIRQILLLLPTDNVISQFIRLIDDFNCDRDRRIRLVNLKEYEEEKRNFALDNDIVVFYCKSGLLKDERKKAELDYKDYENNGEWYLFLDEAHRGDNDESKLKEYVNKLSRNGFLFNFSATFTDDIDILTTCYNFNLERFINEGYGKNILLSDSNYTLDERNDDYSMEEKEMQVLKSFMVFTLIKKNKQKGFYHNPLMITLVNSVNAPQKGKSHRVNSDLSLFCSYMLQIANDDESLKGVYEKAIRSLENDFCTDKKYYFGNDCININNIHSDSGKAQEYKMKDITIEDIREACFNSRVKGALEYYEGEKGKEIVFKLESTAAPFALIRVGDAKTFIKNYLSGYKRLSSYEDKNYFAAINDSDCTINILLGSRAFYEGWDSNRPNIVNLINIGSKDAKKFIPQSIGRGVRIQPNPFDASGRKRLPRGDENKNKLLETLFIFPTDRKSIELVLGAMTELGGDTKKRNRKLLDVDLFAISEKRFDLLLPKFSETEDYAVRDIDLNADCKKKLKAVFNEMTASTFLLQSCRSFIDKWTAEKYLILKNDVIDSGDGKAEGGISYSNYNVLLSHIRGNIDTKQKCADGMRTLIENSENHEHDDIVHFRHIEVELEDYDMNNLQKEIKSVKETGGYTSDYIPAFNGQVLNIAKLLNHYYLPLLYARNAKIDFITHIIEEDSEIAFIESLINFLDREGSNIPYKWMFSKIDETIDRVCIPYFSANGYKNFYPDFVFWQKEKNGTRYKITFIDPKGMAHSDYLMKIDGFESLFYENGKPKHFAFENDGKAFDITVDLKLVNANAKNAPNEYKKWWIDCGNFNWLKEL